MSKEKKQFVVLGVLALLVCAIGAFQFMGGGSKAPVVVEEEKPLAKPEDVVASNVEVDPTGEVIKRLMDGKGYQARDPFSPQAVLADTVQPAQQENQNDPPRPRFPDEIIPPVNPPEPGTDDSVVKTGAPFGLQGVVIGRKTVAVFLGDNGGYVLAQEGDKIGESTFVEEVTAEKVVLRHRGKLRVLALRGGN